MDLIANCIRLNGLMFYTCNRNLIAEYALVRTAGVGEENGDDEWAGSGFLSLVAGHWSLVPGLWSLWQLAACLSL